MDKQGLRLVHGNYENRGIRANVINILLYAEKAKNSVLTRTSGVTDLAKARANKIVSIDDLYCPDNNAA